MRKRLKEHLGIIAMNYKSLFLSKSFYIAVAAVLLFMFINLLGENAESGGEIEIPCVCDGITSMLYFDLLPKIIVLISSMPVVTSFCTDWNTQYIKFQASRIGAEKYARHKIFFCMSGSFLTAFTALLIFSLLLLLRYPLVSEVGISNLEQFYPFGSIIKSAPFLHHILVITCFSAYCSVWSVLGLAISAFKPNRYIVYASPFVLSYIIEKLYMGIIELGVPSWLQIPYFSAGSLLTPLSGNLVFDFLYMMFVFAAIAALFGEFFVYGVKRRMRNEIV